MATKKAKPKTTVELPVETPVETPDVPEVPTEVEAPIEETTTELIAEPTEADTTEAEQASDELVKQIGPNRMEVTIGEKTFTVKKEGPNFVCGSLVTSTMSRMIDRLKTKLR